MKVDWWYRAPDRFRRKMGPAVPGWHFPAGTLIVNGDRAAFSSIEGDPNALRGRSLRPHELSPVDFFTREGFLARAARERHARVRDETRSSDGGPVRVLTVEYEQARHGIPLRFRWVLVVDPATDRITRADWTLEVRDGGWRLGAAETLDRFEYNAPVPDRLFHIDESVGYQVLPFPDEPAAPAHRR